MTSFRPNTQISVPTAVVIVALLAAFVALAAIEPPVAIVVVIFTLLFGDELLEKLTPLLEADGDTDTADSRKDALERLRTRYADGELSDSEFERRLELLLETETADDVERYLAGDGGEGRDRELERSSE